MFCTKALAKHMLKHYRFYVKLLTCEEAVANEAAGPSTGIVGRKARQCAA